MVMPARTSYRKSPRLYLGSHSKIGTKYCRAFLRGLPSLNSLKGSSGNRVSLAWDLKVAAKLLGLAKFTLLNESCGLVIAMGIVDGTARGL